MAAPATAPIINGRRGDWIQVFSGGRFWPLDPQREEIHIVDIAHSLAMQCRFTGHVRKFYSVAEHSVHVSRLCDPADALWGLLHDASEAYLTDLSRPVKKHSRLGEEYERIEALLMEEIARAYGLPVDQPESVERADKIMLAIEARDLMWPLQPGWEKWIDRIPGDCTVSVSEPWSPEEAEAWFLDEFLRLTGAIK